MLRYEHGRRGADDRIIANGGWQDELDELMEVSYKASHGGSLKQQVKGKIAESDEDDQRTRLIRRWIVQS